MNDDEKLAEDTPTNRYAPHYPLLAKIIVAGGKWNNFKRMIECTETARLLRSSPHLGCMVAFVACLDSEVADQIEEHWGV